MYWITPPSIVAVGALLPALATAFVSLRFHLRRTTGAGLATDDWLILFALILTWACGTVLIAGAAAGGLGQETPSGDGDVDGLPGFFFVETEPLLIAWRCKWAFNLLQMPAFGLVKLSVLFFYRRIFRGKAFDICTKIMIGLVCIWTISFFFVVMFQCGTKFFALWSNLFNNFTYCLDDLVFLKSNSISDIVTDVLILAIPAPMVRS